MTDTNTTPRPLIDFSGTSRATAREYAKAANSRVLTTESQIRLNNAARGGKVDAYDLNEAILDAMRSASTRLGQSMARRDLTRKIAYLGHITQAVLQNHADELPEYDSAVMRSRAVGAAKAQAEEAERALAHQGEVNQSLTRDLTEARRLVETKDGAYYALKAAANDSIDNLNLRVNALIAEKTEVEVALEDAAEVNAALSKTLSYALGLLVENGDGVNAAHQVLGFMDANGIALDEA